MKMYNNLRTLRKQAGLTQRKLSEILDIHINEISDMENQKRGPVRHVARKQWEDTLHADIHDIFYFDDEPTA